jgi:hypothetical protein
MISQKHGGFAYKWLVVYLGSPAGLGIYTSCKRRHKARRKAKSFNTFRVELEKLGLSQEPDYFVVKAHSFYELNREYEERCSVAKAMEEINKIGREIMGRFSCGK